MSEMWTGDWSLLNRIRYGPWPVPSRTAPGAKAVVFNYEVPAGRWPEILAGRPTVLDSPHYKSSSQATSVSGTIG